MTIGNLKDHPNLINQYVQLRNECSQALLTRYVDKNETVQWLTEKAVIAMIAYDGDNVLGASVLYGNKDGEIAIFVKKRRLGIGTLLLKEVQRIALKKKISKLWAWIDNNNEASKKIFQKNGFFCYEETRKQWEGIDYDGAIYMMEIL